MKETRKVNVIISKPGGNASKGALNYRISIPTKWMRMLNISKDNKECELIFDEESKQITIKF